MKNMFLITSFFFFITACNEDETKQQENIITENATLYYYFDAGFGTSQCTFVIETESNKFFVPNETFDLSEFTSNNGSNSQNSLKITYRLTNGKIDRCYHKDGFLENSTNVIEIISIEDI